MLTPLIDRLNALQKHLAEHLNTGPPLQLSAPRHAVCASSVLLGLEHAGAARLCIAAAAPWSATGALRLQYEATVRAVWLLYPAPDAPIALLSGPLDDRVLASLTGSQAAMDEVTAAWQAYRDCLPMALGEAPPGP